MKRKHTLLCGLLVFGLLTGCAAPASAPANATAESRESCEQILGKIWSQHKDAERFRVFGGELREALPDTPAAVNMANRQRLRQRFLLCEAVCRRFVAGAALEHLLNRNVFCAGLFCLTEADDPAQLAQQQESYVEKLRWQGSRPQRYLVASPLPGFLLLAYGQSRVLDTFLIRMDQAYPQGQILSYLEIPQKNSPV